MHRWKVIGRGFAGWHAQAPNVSSSGGQLDPYTYRPGVECAGYLAEAEDGALVYDADHLRDNPAAFTSFVIHGPMLDTSLGDDDTSRFTSDGRRTLSTMNGPGGLSGAFSTIATLAQDETFNGLDSVGSNVYKALLRREVPGIRIGHVVAGQIVWED